LNRWKNCQLLYVHGVSGARHNEITTGETFMPVPRFLEAETGIENIQALINFQQK
jgi:hypothetical protein